KENKVSQRCAKRVSINCNLDPCLLDLGRRVKSGLLCFCRGSSSIDHNVTNSYSNHRGVNKTGSQIGARCRHGARNKKMESNDKCSIKHGPKRSRYWSAPLYCPDFRRVRPPTLDNWYKF